MPEIDTRQSSSRLHGCRRHFIVHDDSNICPQDVEEALAQHPAETHHAKTLHPDQVIRALEAKSLDSIGKIDPLALRPLAAATAARPAD